MTSSYSKQPKLSYFPWFDWLRLGLASTVLFYHEGLLGTFGARAGNFAVQVFFALSGWLIGGLLVTLPKRELPRFYFNRALRIWCPYYLTLSLLVAGSLWKEHPNRHWLQFVFYKATFVWNFFGPRHLALRVREMPLNGTGNHFWSVNAEEQFYLMAPLLLVLLPRRYGRSVITWIVVAIVAWASKTYASIVLGVLAAVFAHACGPYYTHPLSRVASGTVVVLSAISFALGNYYELIAPLCAVAIVLLLAIHGERHRWGELVGGMSYPLYLNGWIAGFLINALLGPARFGYPLPRALITIPFGYALSALLYWHFERRILLIRNRVYTPVYAMAVVIIGYSTVAVGICVGVLLYNRWD